MAQLSLFDEPAPPVAKALARASHPDTSHRAAQELVDSGDLAVMETVALSAVEDWPDCTARELDAKHGGNGDRPIGKRLSSLEERGLIAKGAERRCSVSGKVACTWHSVVKRGIRL